MNNNEETIKKEELKNNDESKKQLKVSFRKLEKIENSGSYNSSALGYSSNIYTA
jgi:acyl-CoA thioesterase